MKKLTKELDLILAAVPGADQELKDFIEQVYLNGVRAGMEITALKDKRTATRHIMDRMEAMMTPAEGVH